MKNITFKIFCLLTVFILFISPFSVLAEEDPSEASSSSEPSAALASAPLLAVSNPPIINQYIQNGQFYDGLTWSVFNMTATYSDNNAILKFKSENTETWYFNRLQCSIPTIPKGHKVLLSYFVEKSVFIYPVVVYSAFVSNSIHTRSSKLISAINRKERFINIVTLNQEANSVNLSFVRQSDIGDILSATIKVSNFMCVDLTEMYGAGNEPDQSGFLSVFNKDYYDYTGPVIKEEHSFGDKLLIILIVENAVLIFYFLFGRAWKA